jgi:putative transposase
MSLDRRAWMWHARGMNTPALANPYKRHRFPAEIMSHGVWLYCRFCLSYRDVEEMMAARDVLLTYEAVRYWGRACGRGSANPLRRRRPSPGDTWYLDKVLLTLSSARHDLWRAVDQDGNILDILVQSHRAKMAAKPFCRKLLKGWRYSPWVIMTDMLLSYSAAKREVLPSGEYRHQRSLSNPGANPHQPTHQRERIVQRFKSAGHAQCFFSRHGPILSRCRPRRHRLRARAYRQEMAHRWYIWRKITATKTTA